MLQMSALSLLFTLWSQVLEPGFCECVRVHRQGSQPRECCVDPTKAAVCPQLGLGRSVGQLWKGGIYWLYLEKTSLMAGRGGSCLQSQLLGRQKLGGKKLRPCLNQQAECGGVPL
jgi:hypothetical protein